MGLHHAVIELKKGYFQDRADNAIVNLGSKQDLNVKHDSSGGAKTTSLYLARNRGQEQNIV
jgi:hypothetical protein